MRTVLAIALVLTSSAMVRLAAADSGCIPIEPCPPVYESDAGVCVSHADIGEHCAGDAGTCGIIPYWCAHHDELACLGPVPPAPPYSCSEGGGCSITTDPARAAGRAALPSLLFLAGAFALLIDRRNRRPAREQPPTWRRPER